MEDQEYHGLWWVPSNPDTKIHGILSQKCGQYPILSLEGSFIKQSEEGGDFYEIILGKCQNKKFTLINCLRFHYSFNYSGQGDYSSSKYGVRIFCLGKHYSKKSEVKFSNMVVKYSLLAEWLSRSTFEFSKVTDKETEVIAEIKKPLNYEVQLTNFNLKIEGILGVNTGLYQDSFNRTAQISIESDFLPLKTYFKIINDIRNFLSLAIGEEISIKEISVYEIPGKIDLNIPDLMVNKNDDRISFYPLPIDFKTVSKKLDVYFKNWFLFVEKYEPVYELFFAGNDKRAHSLTKFLNFSQAIEAYHNRKYDDRLFPDQILKEINDITCFCQKIYENLPDARTKSSFKTKFSYLNRKSLRMRMKELFNVFGEVFKIFIKDESKFISTFVDTRNYFTHYDPQFKLPIKYDQFPFLTDYLRLVLITLIMHEIGFDTHQVQRIVMLYCRTRVQKTFSLF